MQTRTQHDALAQAHRDAITREQMLRDPDAAREALQCMSVGAAAQQGRRRASGAGGGVPATPSATLVGDMNADLGVTLVSGRVAAVANQAGSGDFSSSSSDFRPTLSAASINGHAGLNFTSSDSSGRSIQATLGLGAACTICLVAQSPDNVRYLYDGTTSADSRALLYNSSQLRMYAGAYGPSIPVPVPGTWIVSVGVFNGASSKQTISGGTAATGGVGAGAPAGILLGARLGTALAQTLQGKIARALIYSGALSDADRVAVETYLMGWAGLP